MCNFIKLMICWGILLIIITTGCMEDDGNGITDPSNDYPEPTEVPTTNGTMISDEVWQDTLSIGSLTINQDVSLTILPGSVIRDGIITVDGDIQVIGEQENPVYFTSETCTQIVLNSDEQPSRFEFCWFEGSPLIDSQIIQCFGSAEVQISNSVFRIDFPGDEEIIACFSWSSPLIWYCDFERIKSSFKDGYAIYSTDNSYPSISNCNFTKFRCAIYSYENSSPYIEYNNIHRNENGIVCNGYESVLYENEIFDNDYGITVYDSTTIGLENNFDIGYNSIYNCNAYNLVNYTVRDLKAENTYWGTTDEDIIDDYIYDGLDETGLGIVDYTPYLDY